MASNDAEIISQAIKKLKTALDSTAVDYKQINIYGIEMQGN